MTRRDDPALHNHAEYAAHVEAYAGHNADRSPIRPHLDALAGRLEPGALVVDLGCGPGWEAAELQRRGFRAVGVDLTANMLRQARHEQPASGYVAGDLRRLPLAAGALDGAWSCAALLHVPYAEVDAALEEVARVLRHGAPFLASVQAGDGEGMTASTSTPGEKFYAFHRPGEWAARLERAGFTLERLDYRPTGDRVNPGGTGWIVTLATKA